MSQQHDLTPPEMEELTANIPPAPQPGHRFVGFCISCREFVELEPDFSCAKAQHQPSRIAVVLELPELDPLPTIPRFNLGAFLMPPLWGALHGQYFALLLLLVWFFVNNMVRLSLNNEMSWAVTVGVIIATLAFHAYYAMTVNTFAYIRVASERSPEEFIQDEKRFAIVCAVVAVIVVGLLAFFDLT